MKQLCYALAALGLLFGAVGQAPCDSIYWTDNTSSGDIGRASLDGTGQEILITGLPSPVEVRLDVAGGQMYWTNFNSGEIRRANLDGSGQQSVVRGLSGPIDLEPDLAGRNLYWTNGGSNDIRRANLDGSGQTTLVKGLPGPRGIVLDLASGKMYWADANAGDIRRANLDGSGPETLVQGLQEPHRVALDRVGGKMCWSDTRGGDIRRANLDGSDPEIVVAGLSKPVGIALDLGAPGTAVYFAVAAPASVPSGIPFDLTITALDPYGNTPANYQGTVTFSTSDIDPGIVLPADYTFTADDAGVHTFTGGVTLNTPGDQTITATDTASGMTRTVTITVVAPE